MPKPKKNTNKTNSVFKKLAQRYPTPKKVQEYIKTLKYNWEKRGETVQSAQRTVRTKKAHCLEGAILTAAILKELGYPSLVLSIESRDLLCHSIFVFKTKTGWGSVGKSRLVGLHGRAPKFKSLRALAMSYFEPFVHRESAKATGFALIDLDQSGTDWRFSKRNLWKLEKYVVYSKHTPLGTSDQLQKKYYQRLLKHGHKKTGKHWW
jgi:hypothetical protein